MALPGPCPPASSSTTSPRSQPSQPLSPIPQDDILARWLAATDHAATDRSGWSYWQLVTSPTYAELWYEARAAGERLRARAVSALYARNAHPGGRHPDPRGPAAYSERAIVAQAYRTLGIRLWQQPPCVRHDPNEPTVLLMTYPRDMGLTPSLLIHAETADVPHGLILFRMAAMLGYLTREHARLLDPDAPHGPRLIPLNPGIREILHQFAFAFLYLEPQCPPEWDCQCATTRSRFNAPPAEHEQPTDTLTLADLRAYTQQEQQPDAQDESTEPDGWGHSR